jgi:hypothetical protein
MTYAPHYSRIFQVLDVLLFGRPKNAQKYLARDPSLSPQVGHVASLSRIRAGNYKHNGPRITAEGRFQFCYEEWNSISMGGRSQKSCIAGLFGTMGD